MSDSFAMPQRLAVFGAYSDHDLYQRNRILVNILEELSGETLYIRPETRSSGHGFSSGKTLFGRLGKLLQDSWSLWSQRALLKDCDTIFVPYPAYIDIVILWISGQTRHKRVIADAFLELHSTVVEDRKLIPEKSLRARMLVAFQRFTLGKADVVLIDTAEQAVLLRQYLAGTDTQVAEIPVGIDESVWLPLRAHTYSKSLEVLFWGTFIPLHGVEVIIEAVRILQHQKFPVNLTLIGNGQTADRVASLLKAQPLQGLVWHRELMDVSAIVDLARSSDVTLGVFANSVKAGAVVPYKVHQSLAMNRPLVTREASTFSGIADQRKGLYVVPSEDPAALASALRDIAERLMQGWSASTREIYEESFANSVIASRLKVELSR
ncbi:glycosyltransferase [Congregibacter variabilis]|uniref:Glycosyltransferase n=1 Tax=Congregibacter variabilis TaxID=3081200 RepID=A0ABZ0I0Z2_9GAMM|nr:glycosyltransferase [Congregibacter sp. IMCC43200]